MKTSVWTVIICLGAAAPLFADGTNNVLSNEKDRVSYAIGMMIGHNLQQQGLEIAPDLAARAIKDVQSGGTTLLTPQEATQTIRMYQTELAARHKAEGEAFLATNKNKPGIITLPDGLQYKVLSAGTGAIPTNNDMVTVNYRGTLVDGTEFDSSFKRGQPAKFPVNRVIRGWTEALTHMNVGSKWQLFIPSELAYGEQGRPGIPPD
ncbi:MAG TPA: FKBP-type peptidyl-prolyl cis-trans isomerase, partial [Verrucomicrobiae bacterium]|nr:FKBP-type peptidyl-prolyl cis-trans isomerase [Verrucomicrobiae bacterium]